MEKLNRVIQKRLQFHSLDESAKAAEIIHFASNLFTEKLSSEAGEVQVTSLKGGVLWVNVSHSIWAQEVFLVSAFVLGKLKDKFGDKIVQKIKTKQNQTSRTEK